MVESAETNADPEIAFAAQELNQRDGEFARGDGIFAGLEIDVGDAGGEVIEEKIGEFVEFGAIAIEIAIGAAHSAVMAVFAADVREFDNGADEDFAAEMFACGRGGAIVQGGLFAVARQ